MLSPPRFHARPPPAADFALDDFADIWRCRRFFLHASASVFLFAADSCAARGGVRSARRRAAQKARCAPYACRAQRHCHLRLTITTMRSRLRETQTMPYDATFTEVFRAYAACFTPARCHRHGSYY